VEKTVNENRDRLPATDVQRIESAVSELREAAKGDNLDAIRRATDDLQKASHAMAEQLYRPQGSGPGPQEHKNDDIRDGEVVDA
jgi:molecular chaperone DnaK